MKKVLLFFGFIIALIALVIAVAFDKDATYDSVTRKINGK